MQVTLVGVRRLWLRDSGVAWSSWAVVVVLRQDPAPLVASALPELRKRFGVLLSQSGSELYGSHNGSG